MKSRRRHKLKQNLLAQKVGEALQRFQPYWRYVLGVVVILATAMFALGYISKSQRRAQQAGWNEFLVAVADRNPDAMLAVARDHAGSPVSLWAQHASAQAKLIEACSALHRDRAEARRAFQSAKDEFGVVLQQTADAADQALLRQRSLFGLAQTHEGLNELSAARERYQQIVVEWPDSAIGKRAQQRVDSLKKEQTRDFYQWFFAQEPPAPKLPESGGASSLPLGQLPSEPDITLPSFPHSDDLDLDLQPPGERPAETAGPGIFDSLPSDTADPPERDTTEEGETAADRDGAEPDGAEDSKEN